MCAAMSLPGTFDVRHHTFLQAMMSRGPLSEEITQEMYKSILKVNSLDGFNYFLGEINKELEFVDLEVKKVVNQNDSTEYFGMINKLASPQSKLGTKYSTAQISFFKAVMEAIVLDSSGEGHINISKVLNLKPSEALQVDPTQEAGSQVGVPIKMTLGAKEEALGLLMKDQWLSRTHEGGVSLGTRAFLELRGLFRNLEVPFCEVCNEAAIKAELCKNHECPGRMHSYCVARKFRGRQARVCSRCQTDWTPAAAESGHAAENDQEDEDIPADRRVPLSSKSKSRPLSTIAETTDTRDPKSRVSPKRRMIHKRIPRNRNPDAEEEDTGNEEEITRLDSEDDREEQSPEPPPFKRRLRKRH